MNNQNIKQAIHHRNELFMKTYNSGDSAGMADLYTEGGQLMPPNAEQISGKPALQGFWQAVMDMGISTIELFTGEVEQQGDTAIEISRASLFTADNEVADEVKYIVIWKRENGDWKLHRDIFNSSLPAQ